MRLQPIAPEALADVDKEVELNVGQGVHRHPNAFVLQLGGLHG